MTVCSLWVLERFGLRILGDPFQTIATAMLFQTITQPAWPYRPKIPQPGEISGLAGPRLVWRIAVTPHWACLRVITVLQPIVAFVRLEWLAKDRLHPPAQFIRR